MPISNRYNDWYNQYCYVLVNEVQLGIIYVVTTLMLFNEEANEVIVYVLA